MIVRYLIECENCGARILARIGVSYRREEPFALECKRCSQRIRGIHKLDPDQGEVLSLELEGAKQIRYRHDHEETGAVPYQENADFTYDYQPGIPTDLDPK